MNLKNNETVFFSTVQMSNDIKQRLTQLDEKIDALTKQATFWDVYNITQVLLSETDYEIKVPLLSAGESAVVNTNRITVGNNTYHRGDLFYKTILGDLIHIPAENKGIYLPQIGIKDGKITLSYSYITEVKEEVDETTISIDDTDHGYLLDKIIDKPFVSFSAIYNSNDDSLIKPLIKMYIEDNGDYEEFYFDWTWGLTQYHEDSHGGYIDVEMDDIQCTINADNMQINVDWHKSDKNFIIYNEHFEDGDKDWTHTITLEIENGKTSFVGLEEGSDGAYTYSIPWNNFEITNLVLPDSITVSCDYDTNDPIFSGNVIMRVR